MRYYLISIAKTISFQNRIKNISKILVKIDNSLNEMTKYLKLSIIGKLTLFAANIFFSSDIGHNCNFFLIFVANIIFSVIFVRNIMKMLYSW